MERIIHQIWVGPYELPEREKYFIERVKKLNPSFKHILWTDKNLPELPENIKKCVDDFYKKCDYAHVADVLRIFLIKEFGGLYIDVDFKALKKFDINIEIPELFVCYHGGNDFTMPNGVIGCSKEGKIISYICESINLDVNGWYGPSWLGLIVKKYLNLEYETNHEITKEYCEKNNILYFLFYYMSLCM